LAQHPVPHNLVPEGHVTGAAKPREALPKPKEANIPPPTTPPSSRKAWRRGMGLAIIRDISSIILLPLLATPTVAEER
jgi:hypothetical protein